MARNVTSPQPGASPPAPTVSIYQQAEHIRGLLQQLYARPLVTGDTIESVSHSEQLGTSSVDMTAEGAAKVKVPVFGNIEGRIAGTGVLGDEERRISGNKTVTQQEYTGAYYLHLVQGALRRSGLLKQVRTLADARSLRAGDFIEYEAKFDPDQVSTVLDIFTPALVGEITRFTSQKKWLDEIDWEDFDRRTSQLAKMTERLTRNVRLAEAITTAARADFRSDTTREYYGRVGSEQSLLTAITICDTAAFSIDDQDRILDGRFRVLGKVTDSLEEDRPVLERNKLLDKLNPDMVDEWMGTLNAHVIESTDSLGPGMSSMADSPVDLSLDSRVFGHSFKVIPIAIYA